MTHIFLIGTNPQLFTHLHTYYILFTQNDSLLLLNKRLLKSIWYRADFSKLRQDLKKL